MKNLYTLLVVLFSLCSFAQTIGVTLIKDGFGTITDIAHPPGDARLFIAEQEGRVKILNPNQTVNATSFLSLPSTVFQVGVESGLLGLAFHPNYAVNHFFYIYYINPSGDGVISRYVGGTNIANPNATIVMTIPQTASQIHKGGGLRFGPDGYLYISIGDNAYPNLAQNINNHVGKILRIDVNSSTVQTPNYGIPANNPYVGIAGNDEIWAIGLRNPWRINFDDNENLWIGDVGENTAEEINKVDASLAGINFGWNCYEGNAQNTATCVVSTSDITFPIASYPNPVDWCAAVIGGYVYRGTAYPDWSGKYIFADGCLNRFGWIDSGNSINWSTPIEGFYGPNTFGENSDNELVVGSAGGVYRLVDTGLAKTSFFRTTLALYPNPATSQVHIDATGIRFPASVCLFDVSGKLLYNQSLESGADAIETTQLQRGIYMVSVTDSDGAVSNAKLIIQ